MSGHEIDVNDTSDIDSGVDIDYPAERRPDAATTRIGDAARLRSGTIVYRGSTIGDRFQTGHNVVVREECDLGDDVAIWTSSIIDYGCVLGDGVKIHSNCYVAQRTVIGDGAFLAPGVSIANDLYPGSDRSAELMTGPVIGAGAQIGVGVTILPYVRIGDGAMIGAGSVVTADIPPGMLAVGNPARVTKSVAELTPIDDRVTDDDVRRPTDAPAGADA